MPVIDISFRLQGKTILADHGYPLFSSLCRMLRFLHHPKDAEADLIGVHPINGTPVGQRLLALTPVSRLTLRLDNSHVADILPLAGKTLDLDGSSMTVGIPEPRALKPVARLYSRLVVVKGFLEAEPFLEAVNRQLRDMNVQGAVVLLKRQEEKSLEGKSGRGGSRSPFVRRTLQVKDKTIVGYAVVVEGLSAEGSILLQEKGLGGRRHFGCGVFVP